MFYPIHVMLVYQKLSTEQEHLIFQIYENKIVFFMRNFTLYIKMSILNKNMSSQVLCKQVSIIVEK